MNAPPQDELEIRDEVTVRDVLVPIWRYRKLTLWMAALGFVGAVLYQFIATPLYTAQILIAPLPSDLTLSQSGNSIAGLSLFSSVSGNAGPTDFDQFSILLQSPEIAGRLENDRHVKHLIFSNSWDDAKKQWTPDKENFLVRLGRIILNTPWHPPTDADLANYLTKKIKVTPVDPFTQLSYDFKDPNIARVVLGGAVAEAQKVIRDQQHRRANAAMAFLNQQLQSTPSSSMAQQALIALAIEWEQKKLLAETDLDVGVEIAQPLMVSELPTSPSVLIDLLIGVGASIFLGFVLSVALGLFVSDDPEVIYAWLVRRFGTWRERIGGLFGRKIYRLER